MHDSATEAPGWPPHFQRPLNVTHVVVFRNHAHSVSVAVTMARVYADVNRQMPRAYWDYDSVNISWGVLENYEVVKKIGTSWQTAADKSE